MTLQRPLNLIELRFTIEVSDCITRATEKRFLRILHSVQDIKRNNRLCGKTETARAKVTTCE